MIFPHEQLAQKWANRDWNDVRALEACQSRSREPLIAIGGCARSGTTLVRVILDSHSRVVIGPPTSLFIPVRLDPQDIAFRLALGEERIATLSTRAPNRVEFIESVAHEVKAVYGKQIWGDKTARNVHRFKWILEHFPNARIIHVIRDGRDVVCSLRTHRRRRVVDGEIQPIETMMPLRLCMDRWIEAVEAGIALRGDRRYFEVYYEELVANPMNTIKAICEFLKISFEPQMLLFHEFTGPLRDPIRFPQNLEATFPLYTRASGRWRFDLSMEDARWVQRVLNPLLHHLGYSTDDAATW